MRSFEKFFFFSLLASIPIQLGKHFWPPFSFVQGIRVDYLSPTLYVSDIFFILLFIVSFSRILPSFLALLKKNYVVLFFLSLLISTLLAISILASVFGIFKFLEFLYIAFYISQTFSKKEWDKYLFIFTLGALVETIVLIFQFFSQGSLGGAFYFMGERTFNSSTPGIALFQINGQELLRPYGTFPHPNVLACYLLISVILLLFTKFSNRKITYLKFFALLFLSLGIILTFSRVVIILLISTVIVWIYKEIKTNASGRRRIITGIEIVFLSILAVLLFPRYESSFVKDSLSRLNLVAISFDIFSKHPLFGVGVNNFLMHEILYQKNITPTLLQPVHNIYLLWIVQTGILGFVFFVIFLKKLYQRLRIIFNRQKANQPLSSVILLLILSVFSIGLFDHYLLTLQQGQLLLSFILGLTFSRLKV